MYITTAIDYANGKPHIGHAYEKVLADILVRYIRENMCKNTFFQVGTDEHGSKIQKLAKEKGIATILFCDSNVDAFKTAWNYLGIINFT